MAGSSLVTVTVTPPEGAGRGNTIWSWADRPTPRNGVPRRISWIFGGTAVTVTNAGGLLSMPSLTTRRAMNSPPRSATNEGDRLVGLASVAVLPGGTVASVHENVM